MNRILARIQLAMGIKGVRHRQRMYKLCAELNLN